MILSPDLRIILDKNVKCVHAATDEMHSLLRLSLLRALEPNDKGNLKRQLLGGVDDTLGDIITSHDTYVTLEHASS